MAKIVDTTEYLTVLRELVQQGQEVTLTIAGGSMTPFLANGRDRICFKAPEKDPVRGDIVFYQRRNGQFVVHRVWKVKPEGYYIVGDAQTEIEGPVLREQIFAVVTKAQRKGKWLKPGDPLWELFTGPWLTLLPVRRQLLKLYSVFYRLKTSAKTNSEEQT